MIKPIQKEANKRDKIEVKYLNLEDNIEKKVNNKKYFIRTYGCQMNVHDSEEIVYYLEKLGYTKTNTIRSADIIVLNSCAIRENAKEKIIGFLSIAKHIKEQINKDIIICLAGCLMQLEGEIEELIKKHNYIDIVIGTHNIRELPKLVIEKEEGLNIRVYSNSNEVYENIKFKRESNVVAWVNITYGCDNFCTYCIVPVTRGKERSRKQKEIINEIKCLKEEGYKEVTLLGQNVNSYKDNELSFADLLEEVAKTGMERIRFTTSNPWNFSDKLIKVIKKYNNVMPHIHLPVQSGSSEILKKMNRRYTKESYIELFDKIKKEIPNVSVTTDIIVGFPNETEEDFSATLDLVNYCKFDGAFTFIYSKREGTIAAKIKDTVSLDIKKERLYRLNKIVNKYSLENNKKLVGKIIPVLILGKNPKDKELYFGYSDTMKLVNVKTDESSINKIINVLIEDAKSFSLNGKCINIEK